ncbi:MAG: hypothetical protein KDA46_07480 [Parvularculaceae bacterium]|nr:hypothetical protein [Parvularculaceae bacterium]
MASMPALIAALQPFDGRDPTTLNNIGRTLRPDFVVTSKRGGGAADMDFRSAANVILAFYGADSAKDAPAAVEIFRALTGGLTPHAESLDVLTEIRAAQDFGSALETLIDGIPEIVVSSWRYINEANFGGDPQVHFERMMRGDGPVWLEVTLSRYGAAIELCETAASGSKKSVFFIRYYAMPDLQRLAYKLGLRTGADKHVTVRFGLPMLTTAWGVVTDNTFLHNPDTFIDAWESSR